MTCASGNDRYTRPDSLIGQKTYAINLQSFANADVAQQLSALQRAALVQFPEQNVVPTPPTSLHITIFPIIWARGVYGTKPENMWRNISARTKSTVSNIVAGAGAFTLKAKSLRATEDAIILEFNTPAELSRLRRDVACALPIDPSLVREPTITHVTLARFRKRLLLGPIQETIASLPCPRIEWKIDSRPLPRSYLSILADTAAREAEP